MFIKRILLYTFITTSLYLHADYTTETIDYDSFSDGGASYNTKWSMPFYGVAGEQLTTDGGALSRTFVNGKLVLDARPFTWASDFLFFDHIKYFASSNQAFAIPADGSITFSADIQADVSNTVPNLTMNANLVSSGAPVSYLLNEGRQAGATLHMLNFHESGQLFDWFVYGTKAFALIERLFDAPVSPADINTAYTQIVDEFDITPGAHTFSITYIRKENDQTKDRVEYSIDGKVMATEKNIGIPLDKQHPKYYEKKGITDPSQGNGELVWDKMQTMLIGHGLFSLLDVFPYQQQDLVGTSVTIPLSGPAPLPGDPNPSVSSRLWGQGAKGTFDNFKVITTTKSN